MWHTATIHVPRAHDAPRPTATTAAPRPNSLGRGVRLVAAGAVGLGRFHGGSQIPQGAVVHGGNLEAKREDDQRGRDAEGPGAMRVEVPAEIAMEGVSVPILELRVDLRVWEV
eukprot:CAMPEP_0203960482 /NCGR_PEP_ID=MMETSP0359-20131031/91170_1 /ASSEMBLY_ACC=CAM_ASM_000338 /TAXON_ID=268821 /ORGANISM="Scrippsiella Hangoei, Strain SHTV-5" /LENGTH=112 /DNA_ID=CAMNT_0050894843 /DNA_START=53 /DNA_END=388 /DNA_ORIENTATION=-